MWTQKQLIEYDAENMQPIKYDLCAALAQVFLDLNMSVPKRRLEDVIVGLTSDDDLQNMLNVFVEAYEDVHGEVTNNDRPIKSQFAQVKIGCINDSHTHEQLMQKLYKVLESLK
jgi:hypothetical protein